MRSEERKTEEDASNLYNISEETDTPLYEIKDDGSDYGSDEEEDSSEEDNPEASKERLSPIAVLFKTMFTPVEGWKALRRGKFKTDEIASRCFYPLIALAAVSDIAQMFYEAHYSFGNWAVDGLITFITFFFGYFTVILLGGTILPKKSRGMMKTDLGKQFVMICMSTLALFWVLLQLLPMIDPVLVFLPLWTIYLIFKGVRVYRVPDGVKNSTTGYLCLLIILVPLFWNWIFTEYLL